MSLVVSLPLLPGLYKITNDLVLHKKNSACVFETVSESVSEMSVYSRTFYSTLELVWYLPIRHLGLGLGLALP